MKHHIWSEKDDIIAPYIYLYGTSKLGMNIEKVGLSQGIPVISLKKRISNIKAIDTGNGLSNFALQTERIY
ncbi:MAG: hypothetical protein GYA12_05840 [Chloroflexi bacterium]|nr:hypothetical protein [Chloroflexota bacterium]BCY18045.1 hypothetical protein hrd7_18940 [Leptolinea sp. HRD-7]